ELRLGERLAVHVGDQPLRHLPPHVVGEVELDESARHVALAEPWQACLLLHAAVGGLPRLLDDLGGRLDGEATLARLEGFDVDLHSGLLALTHHPRGVVARGCDRGRDCWCERGELNPQGPWAHWILSPARLPIPPLSRRP